MSVWTPSNFFSTTVFQWFSRKLAHVICVPICKRSSAVQIDRAILRVIEFFSLSHSRSLKVIRNDISEYGVCKSVLALHCNYVCISYRYWDIQRQIIAWPWKCWLGVVQDHRKWRHSIDHIRLVSICHCNCRSILYRLRVIWCWITPWSLGYRSLKVIENGTIRQLGCSFLFTFNSNYGSTLYRYRDKPEIAIFSYPSLFDAPIRGSPSEWRTDEQTA